MEAKAKEIELTTRIARLDHVETARRKAETTRLMAECAIAAAVSKVYEDAIKEDAEQYLESDDPDNDDAKMKQVEQTSSNKEMGYEPQATSGNRYN